MEPEIKKAVCYAARSVNSRSGRRLLRARGEKIEWGFAHVLDGAGLRRSTLRGLLNIKKRFLCGIFAFNLSLIMRKLCGACTPKQA